MKKIELLEKVKHLEGLTNEEKSYLINLINTKKKYGLVWEDKPEEAEEQLRTKLPVLKEVKERAIINDTDKESYPNHILIEGDNLHALTALTFTHEGKIDIIYIDPPYNTGEDDFRYNDNYVNKEDGYKHSKWLSFMDKRLEVAKRLLSKTGVLICHIDEHEFDNLSVLLREIFGYQNNLGTIVWNKKNPKGDAKGVANMHEYIFCYARNKQDFLELENTLKRKKPNALEIINKASRLFKKIGKNEIPEDVKEVLAPFNYSKEQLEDFKIQYDLNLINKIFKNWLDRNDFSKGEKMYKYIDNEGDVYRGVSMAWPNKKSAPKDYFIPLKHPFTKKDCPIPRKGWRNPPKTMNKLIGNGEPILNSDGTVLHGEILFGRNETKQPERKYKLKDNLLENTSSLLEYGGSDDTFFQSIGIYFPYAKPLDVAKYLLLSIHPNPEIILDFFAGTGTALHATMNINNENNKRIKCISATNNENHIADDCYLRNKFVIKGYDIKRKNKIDNIPGLNHNNLRYYKCDFVNREPSLSNKRKLTRLATELLCIKEDTYHECTSQVIAENQDWIKFFKNHNGQYLSIIYDDLKIEQAVGLLQFLIEREKPDKKIKVYVFSNGQYPYTEDFEEVLDYITLSALPDAIYKAYQNVLPKKQKMLIPELEEPSSEETEKALETGELDLFNQPEEEE